jgi:hypothetical protein
MNPGTNELPRPLRSEPYDHEARLALLQAAYLQAGLSLGLARLAALADYQCLFPCLEQLAA